MRQRLPLVLLAALTAMTFSLTPLRADTPLRAEGLPRQRLLADVGWKFARGDPPAAGDLAFDDSAWRGIDLPHDWSIEGPYGEHEPSAGGGGYLPTGIGWYRRAFTAPAAWQGRRTTVEFDGVYMRSDVWLNGEHLGHRPFGYIGFEYDLTPHLRFGARNVLAVRVDNARQPNSRWYSGSGIDRHVWLTVTDPLRVAHWGVQAQTPQVSAERATALVRTRIENGLGAAQPVTLTSQIIGPAGQVVASAEGAMDIAANGDGAFEQTVDVPAPQLWSPGSPVLYRVRSLVKAAGRTVDQVETPFGIREARFDVDRGFLLNGQPVKLRGMCLHHDGGSVGAAVPEDVWERRLRLLREMGCNAVRTSHNPAAPEFYDLCDRLGLLVMDEAFDEWKGGKGGSMNAGPGARSQGYSTFFDEWSNRDLTDMLRRDRNHPSVALWSVGNEIGEQRSATGADVLRPLVAACHREDPTRPVTAACDGIFEGGRGGASLDFVNLLDIVGYNYVDRWGARRETYYGDDRQRFPQRRFIGTEDASIRQTRGEYPFRPLGAAGLERAEYATSMVRAEQLWRFVRTHDYVAGYFPWTGFDYLGEAHWPRKASTSGVLDTCGFPKGRLLLLPEPVDGQARAAPLPALELAGATGAGHPGVVLHQLRRRGAVPQRPQPGREGAGVPPPGDQGWLEHLRQAGGLRQHSRPAPGVGRAVRARRPARRRLQGWQTRSRR